jgi:Ankyrin repeats (3 copies)
VPIDRQFLETPGTGNVNVNVKDRFSRTPLLLATIKGDIIVVQMLLDTGKDDVNLKDNKGMTPLLWASEKGLSRIVRPLLKTGNIDVNTKSELGITPLFAASKNGYMFIVRQLLETREADVNIKERKLSRSCITSCVFRPLAASRNTNEDSLTVCCAIDYTLGRACFIDRVSVIDQPTLDVILTCASRQRQNVNADRMKVLAYRSLFRVPSESETCHVSASGFEASGRLQVPDFPAGYPRFGHRLLQVLLISYRVS